MSVASRLRETVAVNCDESSRLRPWPTATVTVQTVRLSQSTLRSASDTADALMVTVTTISCTDVCCKATVTDELFACCVWIAEARSSLSVLTLWR
eukprot:1529902-Prymnesium_polylepis.3